MEEMIYPDGEKVKYAYNTGALLEAVKGEKAYSYNYVNKIGYDKFEQRTYLKYCNGAETGYTYDPERRRLSNLLVTSGKETRSQIMNNVYAYDKVDNVLSVKNTAPRPTAGMGGQMEHAYTYDGLYRLSSATGTYAGAENKSASYTLAMGYDNLHNIISKQQHVMQEGIQFDGILKAGYDLDYTYSSEKPHQIASIKDADYRTEDDAAKETVNRDHAYQYDANGNLIYINTAREKQDGAKEDGANERKMLWDEENRLGAINVNGFISGYWYDAGGERVIKTSGDDEGMYVNDVFSGARTETNNFTAYINPYLVVSKGGQYTKHIYIGSQRIVSKLGDLDSYGQDPRRVEYAGANVEGAKVDYASKYKESQQTIKDNYAHFEVEYNGTDNDDYVNGGGFCCDDNPLTRSFIPQANDNPELFQYYYHSDHLGSSSLITNLDGEVVQHIEYVPFGEVFIEERNNKWNTPYLFNAKELDEETGLYYYGARYYDSRVSVWLSTDPLQEDYPGISSYAYTLQNPVKFIDPDGRVPVLIPLVKGLVGAVVDAGAQYTVARATGADATTALKGIDLTSVGTAFVIGAVSIPGMGTGAKVAVTTAIAVDAAVDINANGDIRTSELVGGDKSVVESSIDVMSQMSPGKVTDSFTKEMTGSITSDLTKNTATKSTQMELKAARSALNSTGGQSAVSGTVAYSTGIFSGGVKDGIGTANYSPSQGYNSSVSSNSTTQASDATRVVQPHIVREKK